MADVHVAHVGDDTKALRVIVEDQILDATVHDSLPQWSVIDDFVLQPGEHRNVYVTDTRRVRSEHIALEE